jgi:hypothetical protein
MDDLVGDVIGGFVLPKEEKQQPFRWQGAESGVWKFRQVNFCQKCLIVILFFWPVETRWQSGKPGQMGAEGVILSF